MEYLDLWSQVEEKGISIDGAPVPVKKEMVSKEGNLETIIVLLTWFIYSQGEGYMPS